MRLIGKLAAAVLLCTAVLMMSLASPALAAKRGNAGDFAGVWDTVLPDNGARYQLTLKVNGKKVTGFFVHSDDPSYSGTIIGTVDPSLDGTASGGRLDYVYSQPKIDATGAGYFIVGNDGTIQGLTYADSSPGKKYGWEGTRHGAQDKDDGGSQCTLAGAWAIVQDNGYRVDFKIEQDAKGVLTGTAVADYQGGRSKLGGQYDDNDRSFKFSIYWQNGAVGKYKGKIYSDNFVKGSTGGVPFHSVDPVTCFD